MGKSYYDGKYARFEPPGRKDLEEHRALGWLDIWEALSFVAVIIGVIVVVVMIG